LKVYRLYSNVSWASYIPCSIAWPRIMYPSGKRYWSIPTSFSFGVALSPLGNLLATPVRLSLNKGSLTAIHTHLSYAENPSPGLGTQIARAVCPSLLACNPEDSKFGSAIHAVLVSELQLFSMAEDRVSHLQYIVTMYMVFTHSSTSDRTSTNILFSDQN
jgi:hypothetical protein